MTFARRQTFPPHIYQREDAYRESDSSSGGHGDFGHAGAVFTARDREGPSRLQRMRDAARDNWKTMAFSAGAGCLRTLFTHAATAATAPVVAGCLTALGVASSSVLIPIAAAAVAGAGVGAVVGAVTKVATTKIRHHQNDEPLKKGWWKKELGKGALTGLAFGALGGVAGAYFHHLYVTHHAVRHITALSKPVLKPIPPPVTPAVQSVTDTKAILNEALHSDVLAGNSAKVKALRSMAQKAIDGNDLFKLQHAVKEISFRADWHHPTRASRWLGKRLLEAGNRVAIYDKMHDVNSWMIKRDWGYVQYTAGRHFLHSPALK